MKGEPSENTEYVGHFSGGKKKTKKKKKRKPARPQETKWPMFSHPYGVPLKTSYQ